MFWQQLVFMIIICRKVVKSDDIYLVKKLYSLTHVINLAVPFEEKLS